MGMRVKLQQKIFSYPKTRTHHHKKKKKKKKPPYLLKYKVQL